MVLFDKLLYPKLKGSVILILFMLAAVAFTSLSFAKIVGDSKFGQLRQKTVPESSREIRRKDSENNSQLIHIVNTRFMQEQAHLVHLAEARLLLFEAFCLPTMISQTIQPNQEDVDSGNANFKFLWIIKTDPNLDPKMIEKLADMLRPYPNFFLVGSRHNFGIGKKQPGSWRGGEAGADVVSPEANIYTGDKRLLEEAHENRERKIVLETRLDADDGLPSHYLKKIQTKAISVLGNAAEKEKGTPGTPARAKWTIWCMSESISWYPSVFKDGFKPFVELSTKDPGVAKVEETVGRTSCLTPGMTLGLAIGESHSSIPTYSHYDLLYELEMNDDTSKNSCGLKHPIDCVRVLVTKAVRSRTPTSAGMKDLRVNTEDMSSEDIAEQWDVLKNKFSISSEKAAVANRHIQKNLASILKDNLKGQCTKGHSCKEQNKYLLSAMLNYIDNSDTGPE